VPNKIKSKKRGNKLGFWFFKFFLKTGGLISAYLLLYFVALYYYLFDKEAFLNARAYLKRRFKDKYRNLDVYKLFVSQGKQLIDRAASISGLIDFNFYLEGKDTLEKLRKSEKGFILLTAHAGNWQIAMSTLENINKKVYLVMRPEDNEALREALDLSAGKTNISIISPESELGGVLSIMKEIEDGNVVAFMGDRPYNFDSIEIDFIGDRANFPYGAFALAAAAGVPVVTMLVAKVGHKSYNIDFTNTICPKYKRDESKKNQLKVWVQEYADILNNFFDKYPFQCFLFYEVWINQ